MGGGGGGGGRGEVPSRLVKYGLCADVSKIKTLFHIYLPCM